MAIQPVARNNLGEQVYEQLRDHIVSGEWKSGDKIPSENELATLFGVSRMTVRQALQRLTALGLLYTKLGEGSFVEEPRPGIRLREIIPVAFLGENTLTEVLEFRRALEGPTAELAAQKATKEDLLRLSEIYEQMKKVREDPAAFSEVDLAFHVEIANITGNSLFIETYSILFELLRAAMAQIVKKRGSKQGIYYHQLILEAMGRGDAAACGKIMREHVEDTCESIISTK